MCRSDQLQDDADLKSLCRRYLFDAERAGLRVESGLMRLVFDVFVLKYCVCDYVELCSSVEVEAEVFFDSGLLVDVDIDSIRKAYRGFPHWSGGQMTN